MIDKEIDPLEKKTGQGRESHREGGHQHEHRVAHYLRRQFSETPKVRVLNDLDLTYQGERAQFDHLIVHPYGFLAIESKNFNGEVVVNEREEWSRTKNGEWIAIDSPLRQAELQIMLLYRLFCAKAPFRDRLKPTPKGSKSDWQVLCAVSGNTVVHRDRMPKDIERRIIKADVIGESVNQVVEKKAGRAPFDLFELQAISHFLKKCHRADDASDVEAKKHPIHQLRDPGVIRTIPGFVGALAGKMFKR